MSLTIIIILVTVAISYYAWQNPAVMDKLILNPARVAGKNQYYRFITSGFVHADFMHLLFNMLTLWFIGEGIEQLFGSLFGANGKFYFLALYILGIIVSDIPTFLKHKNNSGYNSLGASGGVAAVLFSAVLYAPLLEICLYFLLCIPGFIFGILFIGYSYYESRRGSGFVNHDAHMYGAIFGMLFMAAVYPAAVPGFFEQISGWRPF